MKILLSQDPERRIAIVSKQFALIFKYVHAGEDLNETYADRPLCTIELVPKESLDGQDFTSLTSNEIYGFIGMIELRGLVFVAVITGKAKVAAPVPGETVNKISSLEFFCLNDSSWDFLEVDSSGFPISPEVDSVAYQTTLPRHPCSDLRKLLSNGSFYYSSNFDLTSTLQHRGYGSHSLSSDNYEKEFMWNSFLMGELISYRDRLDENARQVLDDEGFLVTVIRGFAETFVTYINKTKVALTVISKQSWKRAGTRYNARGVDDEANVANFVETEFILYSSNYCYSFAEIRGSIPVFWEQDTSLINPKVQITRSIDATQPIFDRHFEKLIDKYGPVHVVNLLSTKSSEIELSRRYLEHIKRSKYLQLGKNIFYTAFDFHKETAQRGFSAVNNILPLLMDSLLVSGYFAFDVREGKVISEQHGIFRTNCLDCLDRTNLVQQVISFAALKTFLEDFSFLQSKAEFESGDFVSKHNTLWADHGDQISQIYTGTNALKSSFSRKGKMSLAGALSDATKSVSRMYINNFMDKGKQQNIDMLLGRLPHQKAVQLYDRINEYVTSELEKMSDKFTSKSSINLFVGSYNVNASTEKTDLSQWLFPIGEKFKPDIFVLGFQEVIELTAGSILNADYSKSSFWENMVSDCINQYQEKYLLLRAEQMSSLLIMLFVRADKTKHVKQVEGASKKTGFGGIAGNKGAVAIKFEYDATSFCFVDMHLSAGILNTEDRRIDYETIARNITFTRSKNISHHDSIFWLGDTNYRIDLTNEEVRRALSVKEKGYIAKLLKYDQLSKEMASNAVFSGFKEPIVKFRPTYKYDVGTDRYDTSEKTRTPSWTDRILFKGSNIFPLAYSDAPLKLSDHRPVYGAYRASVVSIDEAEKLRLTKILYNEYRQRHPDEASSLTGQLINLGLDDEKLMERPPVSSTASSVSLLELDDTFTKSAPVSRLSTPSLSTETMQNLSMSVLQPRKIGESNNASHISLGEKLISPRIPPSSMAFKLPSRPPPPSMLQNDSSANESDNSINRNDTKSEPPAAYVRTLPPEAPIKAPAGFSQPGNHTTSTIKEVSPLPPGFSEVVLTPGRHPDESKPNLTRTPDIEPLRPSSAPSDGQRGKSRTLDPKADILNRSLNSWEPLKPK